MTPSQLAAYLARIDHEGPRVPSEDVLARVHFEHLLAVPFENLDIARGEPIQLVPERLHEKIVTRRRGGFCYELNGLFAELLDALGFGVERLAARVFDEHGVPGIPFDHLCLRVRAGGSSWLADVGFGDSFVLPLRLDDRNFQSDGRKRFRIAEEAPGVLLVEDQARPLYRFDLLPRALADFEAGCRYHQTSPDSPFTQGTILSRITPDGRITLRSDRLITTDASGEKTETPVPDTATWRRLASAHFGIEAG